MTAKRLNILLILCLVLLLGGLLVSTYIIKGFVQTKASHLSVAKAEIDQLNAAQTGIAKSRRDIVTYSQLEKITKTIVPQDKDQAATVRELANIATVNGVALTTITFPSSTLGAVVTPAKGSVAATGAAAATATLARPNLSQLTPVVGILGVYNLQITVSNNTSNTTTYSQFTNFLRGLESNRRTAAVSSINIQPQQDHQNNLVFTLIINTYIKP